MIINGKKELTGRIVTLGKEKTEIVAKERDKAARFLGVWISEGNQKRNTINRVKRDIASFIHIIKNKWISIGQIKYLNNKVLLPRLEYRLTTTFVEKGECDRIYSPMIALIKKKLEMAYTTANSIPIHEDMVGIRTLWQRYIEHSITEWVIRINSTGMVGESSLLRIKQAQLDMRSTESIWKLDIGALKKWCPKQNLNARILVSAKELNLEIGENISTRNWTIEIPRGKVHRVLEVVGNKTINKITQTLKKMDIWFVEQLIGKKGSDLLTWQQLKKICGQSARGKKAKWFRTIEEEVLVHNTQRRVKQEYRCEGQNNQWALVPESRMISKKKNKKEWVLLSRSSKGEARVGRVISKSEKRVNIEIWNKEEGTSRNTNLKRKLEETHQEKNLIIKKKRTELKDITNWITRRPHGWTIEIDPENLYSDQEKENEGEQNFQSIYAENIDWTQHLLNHTLKCKKERMESLINIAIKNKNLKQIRFFTDGSLRREETKENVRLGYAIIQVDQVGNILEKVKGRTENWPSSTRAELAAILEAILLCPDDAEVEINTDSMAAIQGIERARSYSRPRDWVKSTNTSLLKAIRLAIQSKNLKLKLHKIKAHSGVRENEIADREAKKAASEEERVTIEVKQTKGSIYSL